jgi:predicted nucleic acid-binding protein
MPDTAIWVDYLRRGRAGPAAALDGLLERGEAMVTGPIVAEILAGTAERHRVELWSLFAGLPWAEIGRAQWRRVGDVAGALRKRGAEVALTDIEIAVAAVDAGAALWTRDRDFDRVGAVLKDLRRFEP